MKNKYYIQFFTILIIGLFLWGCSDDSSKDINSLKGKTFKAKYESSTYAYCMTFDTNSTGRWFRLYRNSKDYSFDEGSISPFTYNYDYPNLEIQNQGGTSMIGSNTHYDFLSSSVFSDGNFTWVEVDLKDLISSDNSGGNSNGNSGGTTEYGRLSVSPSSINIGSGAGSSSISVSSNTNWSVSINNSGGSVNGLRISTYSGNGNGSVTVSYDAVTTQFYQQSAVIIFTYTGAGNVQQNKTVTIYRRKLP